MLNILPTLKRGLDILLRRPASLISVIIFAGALQTFAQTKLLIPLALTGLNGGSFGLGVEAQLEVDKSVFFGIKRYTTVLDPGYSYSGDVFAKGHYVGGTFGFNYYLKPAFGLQLVSDFRALQSLEDGVQVIGGNTMTPTVPEGLDMDVGVILTTRWLIIPLPKFMKAGLGARYTGLLSRTPATLRVSTSQGVETHEIPIKGLFFTFTTEFTFDLTRKKKL